MTKIQLECQMSNGLPFVGTVPSILLYLYHVFKDFIIPKEK